ncbi:GNAT family N-acetyltransferase [Pseudaestuariivita atlantica]|uniref:N-acetyltransferase domain-containing protein n=1 Tax=Pseudaestuariivita atlantica TaxID=1317121 RepID=A0A0L1JRA1_9RHOB|nr:GNAT family N-acetyltransferase [Pseudaestuariivita atlantica]KNG94266.1 hypothetical protein ATO11_08625 [Pseudaestuariivita atlantica]
MPDSPPSNNGTPRVTLDRAFDRAVMRADLCAYFAELAVSDLDPDLIAQELLEEPEVHLACIRAPGAAGFVATAVEDGVTQICEFYVRPSLRRSRIGTQAAHLAIAAAPGAWELNAMPGAVSFWRHVLATCPGLRDLQTGPPALPHQACKFTFTQGAADD